MGIFWRLPGDVEGLIPELPGDRFSGAEKPRNPQRLVAEKMGRMKPEMETLEHGLKAIPASPAPII
jgi:hypothetical protein